MYLMAIFWNRRTVNLMLVEWELSWEFGSWFREVLWFKYPPLFVGSAPMCLVFLYVHKCHIIKTTFRNNFITQRELPFQLWIYFDKKVKAEIQKRIANRVTALYTKHKGLYSDFSICTYFLKMYEIVNPYPRFSCLFIEMRSPLS